MYLRQPIRTVQKCYSACFPYKSLLAFVRWRLYPCFFSCGWLLSLIRYSSYFLTSTDIHIPPQKARER